MQRIKRKLITELIVPLREMRGIDCFCVLLIGILGGCCPLLGFTTPITLLLARSCKFSNAQMGLAIIVHFFCFPLQMGLMPVFGKGVAAIVGRDTSLFTLAHIQKSITEGSLLKTCADILFFGTIGWLMVALLIVWILRLSHKIHRPFDGKIL